MKFKRFYQITSLLFTYALLFNINSYAQTLLIRNTVSSPLSDGQYYHPSSITLLPGFSFTATSGNSLRLFIKPGAVCLPSATQLSTSQNYIATYTPRDSTVTSPSDKSLLNCQVLTTVQYLDGLGRPLQTVQVKGNADGTRDVVQPFAYDQFGREAKKYLPYTTTSGDAGTFRANALTGAQQAFYHPGGSGNSGDQLGNALVRIPTPFATTEFEASPLNRPLTQGAPGDAWQPLDPSIAGSGHSVRMTYSSNNNDDPAHTVKLYNASVVNTTGQEHIRTLSSPGNYPANELSLTIVKDENWQDADNLEGQTYEYKNKDGWVVLKRTFNLNKDNAANPHFETLSTYYVYDELGNLSFVLPPGSNPDGGISSASNQTTLDNFCYQYRYDGRRRLIEKRLPGKGDWEEMIYNKLDQVVFTRDANEKSRSERSWMKYDAFGRVIMSGVESGHTLSRREVQQIVDNQTGRLWEVSDNTGTYGYSNTSVPANLSTMKALVINYYDDYSILSAPVSNTTTTNPNTNVFVAPSTAQNNSVRGLLTVNRVNILGTSDYLWTVIYYDDKGQVIQSKRQNHLSGTDVVDNTYSFTGELLTSTRTHKVGNNTTTIAMAYTYDHMGRKKETRQWINDPAKEVLLSKLDYNEVGQLMNKQVGDDLETTTFTYNERGWMTGSTSSKFSMELGYNNGPNAQWNGNISSQVYNNNGTSNTFNYTYDKLNRLRTGIATGMSEELSYDVMGNIVSLKRDGADHAYSYRNNNLSNQLKAVGGITQVDYQYDGNGNAITDGRLNKTITYNLLNLPQSVSGGPSYVYTATGQKLSKTFNGVTTHYIWGIQYTGNSIDFIQTDEGVAQRSGTTYSYRYNLNDHLGNVRSTIYRNQANNNQEEVLQQDDYYAFGLRKATQFGTNKYLYNHKELQEELGQYDYGARFYDPFIGRMLVIDNYAEQYVAMSPYQYGALNPIKNIDVNGDSIKVSIDWVLNLSMVGGGTSLQNTTVFFEGGEAFSNTGVKYAGTDSYISAVGAAMKEIGKGPNGKELLSYLEKSTNVTTLYQRPNNETDPVKGSYVFWNPNSTTGPPDQSGNTPNRPSYIGLGHELGHVEDIWKGLMFSGPWFKGLDANGNTVSIPNAEKYATYRENQIRAEHGIPLRTYYSPDGSGGVNPDSKIIDRNGNNLWIRTLAPPLIPGRPSPFIIPPTTIPNRPLK